MLRISLVLALISFTILSFSQNYQSVNSGRDSYFTDHSLYIHVNKVETAEYTTDSVLTFMKNVRKLSDECYDISVDSWHGEKVIVKDNGDNLFFNKNEDTILLKTQALLNDEWLAYYLEDSLNVYAAVTQVDTLTFLGLNDSVKYISFNVFDENMIDISHPLESKQIIISKNYGLVHTISFYHFPTSQGETDYRNYTLAFDEMVLVGMNNPETGVTNLTKCDVFDFQPGDELHISFENSFCTYINTQQIQLNYLERYDSGDSVYYQVKRTIFQEISNDGDYYSNLIEDTIQEIYTLDPKFDLFPEQAVVDGTTAYTNFMIYDDKPMKSNNLEYAGLLIGSPHCWELVYYDGCPSTGNYILGLGGPYYNCVIGTQIKRRELVYYSVGDEEWGIPIVFTDIQNNNNTSEFDLYPNPANNLFSIKCEAFIKKLEILNYQGKMVLTTSNSKNVDISDLSQGVYFVKGYAEGKTFIRKLIVLD